MELALAAEAAERNSKDLQQTPAKTEPLLQLQQTKQTTRDSKMKQWNCYRCGGGQHLAKDCPFKESECHYCRKRGHIAKACRSRVRQTKKTHQLRRDFEHEDDPDTLPLHSTKTKGTEPMMVTVTVNNSTLQMEVDTGAAASVISEKTYHALWHDNAPLIQQTKVKLRTYTGELLEILGQVNVQVKYQGQEEQLPLLVVRGNGPSLLGKDWMTKIRLDWGQLVHKIQRDPSELEALLQKYTSVFQDELGLASEKFTAKIYVDPEAEPKFRKARPVPYSQRNKLHAEIDRLEQEGIIEPIEFSEWAAPIVSVTKPNGSLRICGDYKVTVNPVSKLDKYPLPRIEDLFSQLEGGKMYSKLDLAHAYQQIPLDEASKKYTTINTTKGLYQFTRLPFGISSAPAIFQRIMESILGGVPGTAIYLDDVVVTGKTEEGHLTNLEEVLNRLERAGLRLNRSKSAFMLPCVEYLGHRISAEGIQPTQEKVRAVIEAPTPTNVSQLRSFLGAINYYSKFLPNLSSALVPLYKLLQKAVKWVWGVRPEKSI